MAEENLMQNNSLLRCFFFFGNYSNLGKQLPLQHISFGLAVGFDQRLWSGSFHLQVLYHRSGGNPLGRVLHSPYCTLSRENRLSHMN